jgi:Gram-negative porin
MFCVRSTLLSTIALLTATGAHAQNAGLPDPNPSQGQYVAKFGAGPAANNNNNAWGAANTQSGSLTAGSLSTIYAPNTNAVPTPGTIVIRLNGRVETDVSTIFTNADSSVSSSGAPTGYKLNPIGISSYLRLYPGFDGVSSNGLRYGASAEIRENFGAADRTFTVSGAAAGPANGPSANSSTQTLFVRRAFTYIASDQAGLLRLGQGDGVLDLFDPCIFTSQCFDAGIGAMQGSAGFSNIAPASVPITWVWLNQAGAEYANNKIVYLSPQYYGFDFGAQYAPNMGNSFQMQGLGVSCNQAGPTCIATTSGNDPTRWYNQVGVGLRYQHSFGAVDVKTYGFYETAGKEDLTTAAYVTPASARATGAGNGTLHYDNLNFYKFGVAVTAMNFTLAADYIGGAINGQLAMRPAGGAPMSALVTGVTYANGPWMAGVQIGWANSQGEADLTGLTQRHEFGVATGGTYRVAPGLQLVAEYTYTMRHQGGFDFASNSLGAGTTATTAGLTRDARGQGLVLSTILTW